MSEDSWAQGGVLFSPAAYTAKNVSRFLFHYMSDYQILKRKESEWSFSRKYSTPKSRPTELLRNFEDTPRNNDKDAIYGDGRD